MFTFAQQQPAQQPTLVQDNNDTNKTKQPELEPVDIQYDKVKDWLATRRLIPEDYAPKLSKLHAAIQLAIPQLKGTTEEAQIAQLVKQVQEYQGDDVENAVDYLWCQQVLQEVEILDKGTTTFGFGGSTRLKSFRNIIKEYEKNNLYMAELASKMIQNVKYDIPACDKNIVKNKAQIEELVRKDEDWKRNYADFKKKFSQKCQQLGIAGESIEEEVRLLVKQLPAQYDLMTQYLNKNRAELEQALLFYRKFTSQVSNHGATIGANELSLIEFALKTKAFNVLEWKVASGEVTMDAQQTEKVQEHFNKSKEAALNSSDITIDNAKEIEIDWSALDNVTLDTSSAPAPVIDFDLNQEKEIEIDFGDNNQVELTTSSEDSQIHQYSAWMSEHLLENDALRYALLSDILELDAFFDFRISEKKTDNSDVSQGLVQDESLAKQDSLSLLQKMKDSVAKLLAMFNAERFKELIMIKTSNKYVERLIKSLQQLVQLSNKMQVQVEEGKTKREQLQNQISKTFQTERQRLVQQTKSYQQYLQQQMSIKLLQNRPVSIYGQINFL